MPALLPSRQAGAPPGFASPAWQNLLALACARLQPLVDGVYGAHALMISTDPAHVPGLSRPMVGFRLHWSADGRLSGDLRARPDALPLPSDSMALVVVCMALEPRGGPGLLDECARVLAPEGVALLVGLNRFSPWRWWGGRGLPCRFRGVPAAARMLARRDIETLQVRHFGPLLRGPSRGMPPAAGERRGLGPFRACHLLIARKRRVQATPLRFAQLRRAAPASPGLAGSFREAG
jgi:SAM-dependent methyltransferase